jgi:chromosome segregation ATPase
MVPPDKEIFERLNGALDHWREGRIAESGKMTKKLEEIEAVIGQLVQECEDSQMSQEEIERLKSAHEEEVGGLKADLQKLQSEMSLLKDRMAEDSDPAQQATGVDQSEAEAKRIASFVADLAKAQAERAEAQEAAAQARARAGRTEKLEAELIGARLALRTATEAFAAVTAGMPEDESSPAEDPSRETVAKKETSPRPHSISKRLTDAATRSAWALFSSNRAS